MIRTHPGFTIEKHSHPATLSLGFLLPAGRRIEVEGKKGSRIKQK
jgi:hypothetical protein